jgi:hypothetical protein
MTFDASLLPLIWIDPMNESVGFFVCLSITVSSFRPFVLPPAHPMNELWPSSFELIQ